MESNSFKPINIIGKWGFFPYNARMFLRVLLIALAKNNRAIRKKKGVTWGDTWFNIRKLDRLQRILIRYRRPVKFGRHIVLDSAAPPFPSAAFDRRISNYVNNLDMMELPSGIVSMSTTNCCPYSCAFCSVIARTNPDNDLDEELLKKTITQVQDLGTPFLILHGGEPMYRYDRFLRLVKHVRDDTCLWTFTTGWGVTAQRAGELKEAGLFGAWVSLDHYDPAVHNKLRGNPEAFDNACRAVEYLKGAGIYTCLSLVPPRDLEEPANFRKYYDFARDLGVAEIRVLEMKPVGRQACHGVQSHSLVLENLQRQLHKDPAYRFHPPISGLSTWLEKDRAFGCQCRFEYLFITATGEVQPCESTEISFGNITEEEFPVIFKRACEAFPKPSTGCIPMVMYPEVRQYQTDRKNLTSPQRSELSAAIMDGFRSKGKIPGVYEPIWSEYERRVENYRNRRSG